METILALDRQLFFFISQLSYLPIFDQFALFLSGVGRWGAVWLVIALYLFFREEKRDHWFFLPSVIVLVGAGISEFLLKSVIARQRPTEILTSFSFPSTHATLAFAFAYILSHEEPKLKNWFYVLAVLIALSRVYLGVHYPLDIVGGAILGSLLGRIAIWIEKSKRH